MVHDPVEQGDDKYNSSLSSMLILRADVSGTEMLILLLYFNSSSIGRLAARYQIWATTPPHSRTKQHHFFYVLCDSCNEKKTVVPFKCMAKV